MFGDGAKVAIAESDVRNIRGLWLRGTNGNGLAGTFPPYPAEGEAGTRSRRGGLLRAADYIAVPRRGRETFPWRIVGISEKDGDLLTNQTDVAGWRSRRKWKTLSWIKPGKSCLGLVECVECL